MRARKQLGKAGVRPVTVESPRLPRTGGSAANARPQSGGSPPLQARPQPGRRPWGPGERQVPALSTAGQHKGSGFVPPSPAGLVGPARAVTCEDICFPRAPAVVCFRRPQSFWTIGYDRPDQGLFRCSIIKREKFANHCTVDSDHPLVYSVIR